MSRLLDTEAILTTSARASTIGGICDESGGEVQTGPFGSQLHASDYSQEGTPVVMPQDMINGRISCARIARVGDSHVKRLQQHVLRAGDVVFSRRGDVSRFAVVTEEEQGWLCGTGSIRIRLNNPAISVSYLRHYLRQPAVGRWLEHHAKGVTMPNLNTSIVRALPFVCPPLPEQRRISAVLDLAEELRAKRRIAIEQLDTLSQALFLTRFGDPLKNERGYPVRQMIELVDPDRPVTYGILMPGPHQADGVRYVRVVDMKDGGIDVSRVRRTTIAISESYRRSLLKPGDLLLSIRGHVGRLAVVPPELDGANITQDTARLAIRGASVVFVRECLRTSGFLQWMARHTKGVAVQGINLTDVKLMPIPVPPAEEQECFARQIAVVDRLRAAQRESLSQLDDLFASVQDRAFRGEL